MTKLVEGQWKVLWTRVRFPSGPLDAVETNPHPISKIAVCRNAFCLVISASCIDVPEKNAIHDNCISFWGIQQWIKSKFGVEVSKSSISQVNVKCGLKTFDSGIKGCMQKNVKTDKEKMVLEAFKAFDLL